MSHLPNVVIVLARCAHNVGLFGMRFEEKAQNQWLTDWAFAIKERAAQREGYDQGQIAGYIGFEPSYPGCPYCGARSIFKCGTCARVVCWDGITREVTCSWCGATGVLSGHIESLTAETDR